MTWSRDPRATWGVRGVLAALLGTSLVLTAGCGPASPDQALEIPEGCNPLAADWDCLLPYPSDFFLAEDSTTPGGRRVVLPEQALPVTNSLEPFDPSARFPADGFSPLPVVLALFPFEVDDSELVFLTDEPTASTGAESPTLLLDVAAGELVPHFAELDPRSADPARRALVVHPLVRLRDGARYVVAIRGLRQVGGEPVPAGAGFALLRDRRAGGHEVLGPLAARYERDVFAPLEAAAVERSELQLAWDFTVATTEGMTRDMLRVRELVLAELAASPPSVTVRPEGVTEPPAEHLALRLEGTIEVPLFLESEEPGALLHRDGRGEVARNGTVEVPFLMVVPSSVAAGERPARFVQFGHGFFGSRHEIEDGFVPIFADRAGVVVAAVDFWGMSEPDSELVVEDILEDMGSTFRFSDRLHQAMANQIALAEAARTSLAEIALLELDGELAYDPSAVYFLGISMGHILGGTYLALSPHVERAALSVGGAGMSHMMFRSLPFGSFLMIIGLEARDRLTHQKLAALSHFALDRVDPATYAPFVFERPLAASPSERRVLMQAGLGDPSVPNLATHLHARMLGLRLIEPAPREVFGLEQVASPFDGSALVEYDFGLAEPLPGMFGETPTDNQGGIHSIQRTLPASMDLVDGFLRPGGLIECRCEGVCDPE